MVVILKTDTLAEHSDAFVCACVCVCFPSLEIISCLPLIHNLRPSHCNVYSNNNYISKELNPSAVDGNENNINKPDAVWCWLWL